MEIDDVERAGPAVPGRTGVTERAGSSRATWWWVLTLPLGLTTWAAFL